MNVEDMLECRASTVTTDIKHVEPLWKCVVEIGDVGRLLNYSNCTCTTCQTLHLEYLSGQPTWTIPVWHCTWTTYLDNPPGLPVWQVSSFCELFVCTVCRLRVKGMQLIQRSRAQSSISGFNRCGLAIAACLTLTCRLLLTLLSGQDTHVITM